MPSVRKPKEICFGLQDPWFLFNVFVYVLAKSHQHFSSLRIDPLIQNFMRDFPFIAVAITTLWFITNKMLRVENSDRPSEHDIVLWTMLWCLLLEFALPIVLGIGTCDTWDVFAYCCNALLTIKVWSIYYSAGLRGPSGF
jgi:hypothetical protein